MILDKKIYNIPVATGEDGQKLIDMSLIKLMLYVDSFGINIQKEQEKKNIQIDIKDFKTKLNNIFMSSLMVGPYPWKNPSMVIGTAPGFDICFNKNIVDIYKNDIILLLDQVGDIAYFSDLKILKNGQVWTELVQDIQKLMALANAAGLIDYRVTNTNMFDKNPELSRKK